MIEVELYYSPYCRGCGPSRREIRALATAAADIQFSEWNVLEHIEAAAARGVRVCPAIVINGRVVMSGKLSLPRLRAHLHSANARPGSNL